jgi:hypothetical protein
MMAAAERHEWQDIAARHWEGGELDCAACPHAALRERAGCEPGHTCMQDAYARRIDRFFRTHPELANQHLGHGYFEVRAIAARHADVFRLPSLMNDPDETVRLQLALRLPQRQLMRMRTDPHREVRIRVAQRLAVDHLASMLHDEDYCVRATVARRLPETLLPLLTADPDSTVRREVARRLQMPSLWRMVGDPEPEVRRIVAERLPEPLLEAFVEDPDLLVRWEVVNRAAADVLARLADDPQSEIRERAGARIGALQPTTESRHG